MKIDFPWEENELGLKLTTEPKMSYQESDLEEIYKIHESIGFPQISEQDQANILIWGDTKIINKLTPGFEAKYLPWSVTKRYFKLSKQRFRLFFRQSGYIEELYNIHLKYPKLDSTWVEKEKNSKYRLKVQERGSLVHIELFETYEMVVDYFVDSMFKKLER